MEELLKEYEKVWAIGYSLALMGWDSETYMPEGSARERGEASAALVALKQSILTSEKFLDFVERANEEASNDVERGIVRVLRRALKYYTRVPVELLREEERVTNEAKIAWRKAKKRADFNAFRPYLERIVEIKREEAEHLGYENHPYDALLDLYEEGFTVKDADQLFSGLKPLTKELERILSSGWPQEHPLEEAPYDAVRMRELNERVLGILGFEREYQRLDASAHPFTEGIGLYDVRITTWYHGKDFRRSLLATVHEFGHSLYERGCDPSLWKTPVCGGVSLGVHESQSRFWENYIARSRAFSSLITPLVKEYLGLDVSPDDVFTYFNLVRPSTIRVEADEVTYNFHIMLRYELEKGLIEGSLEVKELPQAWNEKMEEYLGITPPNDAEGVLQDIHWSLGAMGYFPTYSIGTVLAVQIGRKMEEDLDLPSLVSEGNFSPIREWLREKIHRWGSVYPPKELVRRALGEDLDPKAFVDYVKVKYR